MRNRSPRRFVCAETGQVRMPVSCLHESSSYWSHGVPWAATSFCARCPKVKRCLRPFAIPTSSGSSFDLKKKTRRKFSCFRAPRSLAKISPTLRDSGRRGPLRAKSQ